MCMDVLVCVLHGVPPLAGVRVKMEVEEWGPATLRRETALFVSLPRVKVEPQQTASLSCDFVPEL